MSACVGALALLAVAAGCGKSSRHVGSMSATGAGATGGAAGAGDTGGTGGKGGSGGKGGTVSMPDAGEAGDSGGSKPDPECTPGIPTTSQIPRLTNQQYDRTVRDLLQVTALDGGLAPSELLAPDSTLALTAPEWAAYLVAGEAIAVQVLADPTLQRQFLVCEAAAADTQCLHDSVVAFGRRAFRRPLTEAELARFDAITARGAELTATGAPLEVAEVLLNTFLVSPSFIQRSEISGAKDEHGHFVLSSYEVASRLSFMLWGSTPDETLDQAADANELTTPEQIRAQAERMLAHPKAREMVTAFHRAYVRATPGSRWYVAQKDPTLFPTFDEAVVTAMNEETERFFEHVVFDEHGTFGELFTSPVAYVNAATAPLYGLDPASFGADLTEVTLDPATRPGFLTRIGFLSAFSAYDRTEPILRGAYILKDVVGLSVGDPIPDAAVTPGPPRADFATNREYTAARTAGTACNGCHEYINPAGYVLEAYDAIGGWRTDESDTGAPIDTAADVYIDGDFVPVADPADLMQRLALSRDAKREYAKRWVAHAYERGDELDSCTVKELGAKLTEAGYTVLDLLTDLTQPESFRVRVREAP